MDEDDFSPYQMSDLADTLERAAGLLRVAEREVREVRATKTYTAIKRAEQAEKNVADLTARLLDEQARNRALGATAGRIRAALNGAGCNPLDKHAARIFAALKKAAPNHPLVKPKEEA